VWKETCVSLKETCVSSKETNVSSKETYASSTEAHVHETKDQYTFGKRPIYMWKETYLVSKETYIHLQRDLCTHNASYRVAILEPPAEGKSIKFPRKHAILADCATMEDPLDALSCRSFFCKRATNYGALLREMSTKIRHLGSS